jgi:tight adherence protein C
LVLLISLAVFAATVVGTIGFFWWLETRKEMLAHRIKEVVGAEPRVSREEVAETTEKWFDALRDRFAIRPPAENELVERLSGKELTGRRFLLGQAGYRSSGAYGAYLGFRLGMVILFVVLVVAYAKGVGMSFQAMNLLLVLALLLGILLPDFLLRLKIRRRQEGILDSLPDALDLLVVCVESGLGLNSAFMKITEEFMITNPALSDEFDIVNREMVAGKPRQDALRSLSDRTGIEEIKSLVAMLVQTEKLGTSLSMSLRIHSDSMRTRRRQRAEEEAAKTTIKLVFPLVFLLFPALYIVILGPALIQLMKVLLTAAPK